MSKFYGQNNLDQFLNTKFFNFKTNGISIECGSFDGITESSTFFFEESLGWNCINIEASPPIFDKLSSNRKKSINLNLGLGEEKTIKKFNHVIHPSHGINFGNGSFNHKEEHITLLIEQKCVFREYEVMIDRYDNIIDSIMNLSFPMKQVDLFVLDVEGYELQVIEGMKNSKYLPYIFCIEFPFVGLENLISYTNMLGYEHKFNENNNAFFQKRL